MEIARMRYHGPGWQGNHNDRHYQVWGPTGQGYENEDDRTFYGANPTRPDGSQRGRNHWAAGWRHNNPDSNDGGYVKGAELDQVLRAFPFEVREAFGQAVATT